MLLHRVRLVVGVVTQGEVGGWVLLYRVRLVVGVAT